ncbi:uncharacterized protein HMPREF1541_10527 [Cyphellophora europaea CBS 101466]|uniref:C2H2-type domain-containing protein n=1 Tax=Cyphellophora europaea (strain CBS 101466) TaxID=1220924 RepID=W2S6N9_CYPE1|nr:uncharacterized protein HMPREF1541_10527 [Cyphellophora europaea CBS 101466]ETN44347.1 hypothetical protein HMPREF1541_10527 [Cyphellophora europaea CBS 101466]
MSLHKGNTFHYSSSPPKDDDPILSIHHLARRSPTCSQSMLASWLSDKTDVTESLRDFEETFSGARGRRSSNRRRSIKDFEDRVKVRRGSVSSDEGLGGSVVSASSDKSLSQKFERALDLLERDSALGSSIGDRSSVSGGHASEEDGSSTKNLIQATNASGSAPPQRRQKSTRSNASAVTQSVAPPSRSTSQPLLSPFARKKINKYIIAPILREERFEDFHPLVSSLGVKSNKNRCLRDIERSLIFQPLTFDITPQLYRTFGEFSIQLVLDTYQQLPETEQRRADDRPYDNGYFLDLVQQVGRLASQIGHTQTESGELDTDSFDSPYDEVTLEGGLSTTGNMAELVGWKNGRATSLRTGEEYTPLPGIKRSASSLHDEDVARSMARRKKGVIPEIIEMQCSDPGCDKIFTRKCDLAKHEKTHSRPFKCPHKDCKYSEMGLPTEKERDRHINDKHDPNPHFYQCQFCEFKTKRESNCKQHMEKKHSWNYERAKGKDKNMTMKMTPGQTPQTPALDYNSSMQSPMSYTSGAWDESRSRSVSLAGPSITSAQVTPFERPLSAFEGYGQASNHSAIFPRSDAYQQSTFDFNSFVPGNSYISPVSSHRNMTPSTPAYSNITGQSPFSAHMDVAMDYTTPYDNYASLPTPESFLQSVSRHQSISNPSPMYQDVEQSNMYDGGDVFFDDPLISGTTAAPDHDFDLFSGVGDSGRNAFTNPSAANATLFPIMQNDEQFHAAVEKELIDEIYSESESNYDYGAN